VHDGGMNAPEHPPSAQSGPPAYDMSLTDHGFAATEIKGLTYPLGGHAPKYGEIYPLAPDLGWIRMPVPGNLGHINLWLLDDGAPDSGDLAIADTGLFLPDVIAYWKALFAGPLADRNISRIFVTHFHPDHVGCAGWLANRFKVPVWMNRTEWLLARLIISEQLDEPPAEVIARRKFAGYDDARLEKFRAAGWGNFAKAVAKLPPSHNRLDDKAVINIGARSWQVLTGGGHTPEHACLVDHHNGVIIAGDQILPRITSNVSLMDFEPHADPLGEWLASIAKFQAALPADMLVLPAHGDPFRGVHVRLEKLASGHHLQLDRLADALREGPMRAVDTFSLLFARPIDDSVFGMATGEAQAHLRHLERTGRAICENRDGVGYYHAP
jgi:glyoxylase-like metal-dependent hydrolase (beta-lactamase superfamily II)